jgi:hypothetical protein
MHGGSWNQEMFIPQKQEAEKLKRGPESEIEGRNREAKRGLPGRRHKGKFSMKFHNS